MRSELSNPIPAESKLGRRRWNTTFFAWSEDSEFSRTYRIVTVGITPTENEGSWRKLFGGPRPGGHLPVLNSGGRLFRNSASQTGFRRSAVCLRSRSVESLLRECGSVDVGRSQSRVDLRAERKLPEDRFGWGASALGWKRT